MGSYRDATASLITTFEQHKGFFVPRIAYLYERLSSLVRQCRQLQQTGDQARGAQQLQQELLRLFGVRVQVPSQRQLSMLAALIRHVLVADMTMRRQLSVAKHADEFDVLALDAGLQQLSRSLPDMVCLLELRYFARLSLMEVAQELDVSVTVIKRDLRLGKAWLLAGLSSHEVMVRSVE